MENKCKCGKDMTVNCADCDAEAAGQGKCADCGGEDKIMKCEGCNEMEEVCLCEPGEESDTEM